MSELRFGRTHDRELIRHIITHPKVWKWMAEDGVSSDSWEPVIDPRVWYVVAAENKDLIGLFVFSPRTSVEYEVHLAVMPLAWHRATETAQRVIAWAWEHIGCERIVAWIPVDNKHALRLARKSGFTEFGLDHGAYRRGGKLLDIRFMGISKEDEACRQPSALLSA